MAKYDFNTNVKKRNEEPDYIRYQPFKKRVNLVGAVSLIAVCGLAAILGTPDQDPVERARMYQRTTSQQPAYSDSSLDSLKINSEEK